MRYARETREYGARASNREGRQVIWESPFVLYVSLRATYISLRAMYVSFRATNQHNTPALRFGELCLAELNA